MKKATIILIAIVGMFLIFNGSVFAISPDIKADGSDTTVSVSGDSLSLTISLDAEVSIGQNCDWWLVYYDGSEWFYYDLDDGWQRDIKGTYQGSLVDLSSTKINVSNLSTGSYTFYFGVDTVANGTVDTTSGVLFFDSVVVNVTSSNPVNVPDTAQTTGYTDTVGEDSDYTNNAPSYTDNGNDTVTDNVTSLIWQSLVEYGLYIPSLSATYFPNVNSLGYWSSTTNVVFGSDTA